MRNLLKVRASSVTMAAANAGYQRCLEKDEPATNLIAYRRYDGSLYLTGNPETMPPPLRFAVRALNIAFFAGKCRLCGARAQSVTVAQMRTFDLNRWQVVTGHQVADGEGSEHDAHFAIEHAADCPCAPEHIERMANAGSN